ncbi:MAG: MFS transporter, partial [Anaerolineae bacterium]|nr:MFS transporter [Anaerolineae bacterium]
MTKTSRRGGSTALYVISCFLFWISLYLYVPTLPTYAESKTTNLELVGVVLMQYGLWQTVIRIPVGILSDWLGRRKPFILSGLVLAGVAALVMGSSTGVNGLIAGRAISGLAAGAWVLFVVAFSSLFPAEQAVRATTLLNLVSSFGRVLATGSNGWLIGAGGYSLPFWLAGVAALLAVLFILPVREEPMPGVRPSLAGFLNLVKRRDVMVPSLLSTLAQYVAWATTLGFMPILAQRLGASSVMQSLLVSGSMIVGIGGNLLSAAATRRIGPRRVVALAFTVYSLGIVAAALSPTLL